MAGLHICFRLLLVSLAVASAQAFLAKRELSDDISDVPEPGYAGKMTSSMVKRMPDLSINQDLKTLANMLLMREYARQAENRRNRELLKELGKRSADFGSQSESDADVADADGSYELGPEESNENWARLSEKESAEAAKYSRKPSLNLWRILASN
ncbi:hypothetical protein BaRGS_00036547 [Batillaria attramentaria]|uniref:Corticotropin-releasing factor domain-containing protein n=1 Tax=Batillaria attramentaria TaxID=370345 RepID=A0ABD0JBM1_9CAEN|nr:hypothetical protein BaRGS_010521 [Batillaria attramentaria]